VDITREEPAQIARRGVIRSFQISATFGHMTRWRTCAWRCSAGWALLPLLAPSARSTQLDDRAMACWSGGPGQLCAHAGRGMPYGRKRALEIATTLALDPKLMLLDEPTQGMGHEDVDRVAELIKKVAANRTVLMVEHNLSVVENLCDPSPCCSAGR
jgi:branched-chain amino acid transport system ATP-binding protein